MHKQTGQMDAPETDGSAGVRKLALRLGSGGNVRSGESPDASTFYPKGGMCAACARISATRRLRSSASRSSTAILSFMSVAAL